jgi:hypothetical protein
MIRAREHFARSDNDRPPLPAAPMARRQETRAATWSATPTAHHALPIGGLGSMARGVAGEFHLQGGEYGL